MLKTGEKRKNYKYENERVSDDDQDQVVLMRSDDGQMLLCVSYLIMSFLHF